MIVYPGIEERIRESRRFWESLVDDQIAHLDPKKREAISEACGSCKLSSDDTRLVLATTCDLLDFERYGRDLVLSNKQRLDTLASFRDAARSMTEAMGALSTADRIALQAGARATFREQIGRDTFSSPCSLFSVWSIAAEKLLRSSQGDEGKGGRRPLLTVYRQYVETLAFVFEGVGLPVGRGGPFERLCSTVFEVAGVRAAPEGAIRSYLAERKKQAKKGSENSTVKALE